MSSSPPSTTPPEPPPPPEPRGSSRPWAAFLYADYRFLWMGSVATIMVMWLRILVTSQWLFEETGSAAQLGVIGIVQLVVQIPALLYGGTLADQVDRRYLMAAANGVPLVVLGGLGVLDATGSLHVWTVYLAIAITAATQMIASPAQGALVPKVVPERLLMTAITTDVAGRNVASIAGPLLFAVVAASLGLTQAFFAAALVALPATLLPLGIRTSARPDEDPEGGPTGNAAQRTWAGFRFVSRHPILPGLFLLDWGITVVSFYREILPALASGLYGAGRVGTGVLGAANSAGAIVGALLALLLTGYRSKGMLVLYASLAYSLILFGFGTVPNFVAGTALIALLGGADSVTVAVRQTTVQLTTPDHMRGRAFAFMILAAQTANNIGTIWVGFWSAAIGTGQTMVLGSVLAVLATIIIWRVWRPIREYRYP